MAYISYNQYQALKTIFKNNGTTTRFLVKKEIYSSRKSSYRALENLKEKEMVEKNKAPKIKDSEYIYEITDKGKNKIEVKTINSDNIQ